jgi:NAD(P)-dependent dehydrogenase (short-subunit alcohol dehydrogenase family)
LRLEGKKIIVTGAASGIGRAVAERFAAEGACVAAGDINEAGLRETVAAMQQSRGCCIGMALDVSSSASVKAFVDETLKQFGQIDVLVNCAAISDISDTDILTLPEEVFDRTLAVNLKGTYYMCKTVLPEMLKSGAGSIVNFTSGARRGGGSTAYPVSKGGISTLTRSIAHQFAERGIRCNEVSPGTTDTPMLAVSKEKLGSALVTRRKGSIQRWGEADEIASVALFLASDESSFVSASTYTADGGNSGY